MGQQISSLLITVHKRTGQKVKISIFIFYSSIAA